MRDTVADQEVDPADSMFAVAEGLWVGISRDPGRQSKRLKAVCPLDGEPEAVRSRKYGQ